MHSFSEMHNSYDSTSIIDDEYSESSFNHSQILSIHKVKKSNVVRNVSFITFSLIAVCLLGFLLIYHIDFKSYAKSSNILLTETSTSSYSSLSDTDLVTLFDNFIIQYNRIYTDEEYTYRYTVFLTNLDLADERNEDEAEMQVKDN